jgi:rsbT co-antagonist protein RsbR
VTGDAEAAETREAALGREVARLTAELERQSRWTRQVLRAALEGFHVIALDGRIVDCNEAFAGYLGYTRDEVLGKNIAEIDPNVASRVVETIRAILVEGSRRFTTLHRHRDGRLLDVEVSVHGVELDGAGALVAFSHTIGEQLARERALRLAESERAQLQAQVIEAQAVTIGELSTPLIPLGDGVLVVPIVGRLDPARAAALLERLLAGVAERRARATILDLTGVQDLDAAAASGLLRAASAVRLLGAAAIVTGIRPDVARALIDLGVDLDGLVTLDSLQSGIRHAERLRGEAPARGV